MSRTFYWQLYQALQHQAVVVATVIRTRGSTPREVGAKMIIPQTGSPIDTIGGGAGEAKVCQQARLVLATGEKQCVDIDLSGAPQRTTEGVCGGWMQVWLERWSGEAAIDLTQQILRQLQAEQPGLLVTPLTAPRSPYLLLPLPDVATPVIQPESQILPESVEQPVDQSTAAAIDEPAETLALVEPLPLSPTLLIVGGGHVAVPLAQMAHLLGFQLIVQDDRPDFACADRFPPETVLWAQPMASIGAFPPPAQLYIALVTRGYQYDLEALQHLLKQPFPRYVGMIGSRKRVQLVLQALQQDDVPLDWLRQIRAPIGLDIGALTPEEIAVSICAELIQVRRGGTGQPLSLGLHAATLLERQPIQIRSQAYSDSASSSIPRSVPQSVQISPLSEDSRTQYVLQQISQQQS